MIVRCYGSKKNYSAARWRLGSLVQYRPALVPGTTTVAVVVMVASFSSCRRAHVHDEQCKCLEWRALPSCSITRSYKRNTRV